MKTPIDPSLMERAIELSQNGFPAPNPHVGCVIERDGEIVGEGYHDHAGGPHAEVVALQSAGDRAKGATAYVTLEPCNHQGRTGPCSEALIQAGIARVVMAVSDPNPKAQGGAERLRTAGIEVIEGVLSQEAERANIAWLTSMRLKRPYVVGKAALTLDGRIALPSGQSKWITGEEARRQAHILRAECGAVLVGRGTVEADDPELTVRHVPVVNQPLRVVLDRGHKLDGDRKVFNASATSVRAVEAGQEPNDLEVLCDENGFQLDDLLTKLFSRGVTSLLVEGGAGTLSRFLESRLVDRLELFVAPTLFGSGTSWTTFPGRNRIEDVDKWRFESVRRLGEDLWITASPNLDSNGNHTIPGTSNN